MKEKSFIFSSNLPLRLFTSCATKIQFDKLLNLYQSQEYCVKSMECPVTIMCITCLYSLMSETGEKISSRILRQEGISARDGINLTLAKIRGRYFVTGEGFGHLWMLTPTTDMAKIKKYAFPAKNLAMPPVFEINKKNLLMRGAQKEYQYIVNIDTEKWESNNTTPKAGA